MPDEISEVAQLARDAFLNRNKKVLSVLIYELFYFHLCLPFKG